MTGPGRPRTGTPALVRIPPDDLAALDAMAAEQCITRAELIRRLLARALKHVHPG